MLGWRAKPDAPQTPEALDVVSRHYTQRFGHPQYERARVGVISRQLDMDQSLQLMQEALEKGEQRDETAHCKGGRGTDDARKTPSADRINAR
jgi:hypothetical protein